MHDDKAEIGQTVIRNGRGRQPKQMRVRRKIWTEAAESRFLDCLAMTANATMAAEAAGFHETTAYRYRREDPAFHARWREALEAGYDRLEGKLLEAAERCLSGTPPAEGASFPEMTVDQALRTLETYRRTVRQGRSRVSWRRQEKPIDAVRASIARKLDAIERARARADAGEAAANSADGPGHD